MSDSSVISSVPMFIEKLRNDHNVDNLYQTYYNLFFEPMIEIIVKSNPDDVQKISSILNQCLIALLSQSFTLDRSFLGHIAESQIKNHCLNLFDRITCGNGNEKPFLSDMLLSFVSLIEDYKQSPSKDVFKVFFNDESKFESLETHKHQKIEETIKRDPTTNEKTLREKKTKSSIEPNFPTKFQTEVKNECDEIAPFLWTKCSLLDNIIKEMKSPSMKEKSIRIQRINHIKDCLNKGIETKTSVGISSSIKNIAQLRLKISDENKEELNRDLNDILDVIINCQSIEAMTAPQCIEMMYKERKKRSEGELVRCLNDIRDIEKKIEIHENRISEKETKVKEIEKELTKLEEDKRKNNNVINVAIPFEEWYLRKSQNILLKIKDTNHYKKYTIPITHQTKNGSIVKVDSKEFRVSFFHPRYRRVGDDIYAYVCQEDFQNNKIMYRSHPSGSVYEFRESNKYEKSRYDGLGFENSEKNSKGTFYIEYVEHVNNIRKLDNEFEIEKNFFSRKEKSLLDSKASNKSSIHTLKQDVKEHGEELKKKKQELKRLKAYSGDICSQIFDVVDLRRPAVRLVKIIKNIENIAFSGTTNEGVKFKCNGYNWECKKLPGFENGQQPSLNTTGFISTTYNANFQEFSPLHELEDPFYNKELILSTIKNGGCVTIFDVVIPTNYNSAYFPIVMGAGSEQPIISLFPIKVVKVNKKYQQVFFDGISRPILGDLIIVNCTYGSSDHCVTYEEHQNNTPKQPTYQQHSNQHFHQPQYPHQQPYSQQQQYPHQHFNHH
ncbi:hypothetical protein QTN25_001685 [Entamoeba marina]